MIDFNVVLLQAAFDDNDLEQGELYGQMVVGLPNLRLLVTKSALDGALCNMFPLAHRLEFFHPNVGKVAMGAAGPSAGTANRFGGCQSVQVTSGIDFTTAQPFAQRLVCADLQPLHAANNTAYPSGPSGHHTDIYHDEIYGLIARFLY
jgi:hypothetical protein